MNSLFARLTLADLHRDVARNIVSLRESQDLFDDLTDNPAEWSLAHEHDGRARAAALRFARTPIDLIADADPRLDAALANDEPLSVI